MKADKMDGVLRLYKPKGMTSHDLVSVVRRHFGQKEVGHAGTLDPMAQGLMILLLGQATKLSDHLLTGDKAYIARVMLGQATDTWDLEGEVVERSPVEVSEDSVVAAVRSLEGEFDWQVPAYSAIKQKGEKLYDKARNRENFEPPSRTMRFGPVRFLEMSQNEVTVDLACSKGSYIRSWAVQLGKRLNSPSCLSGLERTFSAPYSLDGALTLSEMESLEVEDLEKSAAFVPFRQCLPHLDGLSLKGKDLQLLRNGQIPHGLQRRLVPQQREVNALAKPISLRILDGETRDFVALMELSPCRPPRLRRVFVRGTGAV